MLSCGTTAQSASEEGPLDWERLPSGRSACQVSAAASVGLRSPRCRVASGATGGVGLGIEVRQRRPRDAGPLARAHLEPKWLRLDVRSSIRGKHPPGKMPRIANATHECDRSETECLIGLEAGNDTDAGLRPARLPMTYGKVAGPACLRKSTRTRARDGRPNLRTRPWHRYFQHGTRKRWGNTRTLRGRRWIAAEGLS